MLPLILLIFFAILLLPLMPPAACLRFSFALFASPADVFAALLFHYAFDIFA